MLAVRERFAMATAIAAAAAIDHVATRPAVQVVVPAASAKLIAAAESRKEIHPGCPDKHVSLVRRIDVLD